MRTRNAGGTYGPGHDYSGTPYGFFKSGDDFAWRVNLYVSANGKIVIPFDRVVALAKYYKVSLDYIAGYINEPRPLVKKDKE